MVTKHDQFICIATANTWGNGSDRQYVGRQSLDAATLNRLTVQIEVNYDEKMERTLAISESPDHGMKWLEAIAQWRERAQNARLPIIISPRQTIAGSRLLQAGMGFNEVRDITVFAGLNQEAITTLTTVRS